MIAMMPCRFEWLHSVAIGFFKTGIPLIGLENNAIVPFAGLDDIGLYIIIPKLMYYFNLSFEHALSGFFYALVYGSAIAGFLGLVFLYRSWATRIMSTAAIILLSLFVLHIGDVYVAYFASIFAIIPLFLALSERDNVNHIIFFLWAAGIFLSFMHYIRAYASVGVILFVLFFVLVQRALWLKKMKLIFALILGMIIPITFFAQQQNQFKRFTHDHKLPTGVSHHPFWHSIYLGFGFLQFLNQDKISWDDQCGIDKGKAVRPSVEYGTAAYENYLKGEVVQLVVKQSLFVLFTLFAKLGILLLFLLLGANIGLLCHGFAPNSWPIECGFLILFLWYALFPLIAMPYFSYALGFIAVSVLYGLIGIGNFVQCFELKSFVKRAWHGT